MEKKQNLPLPKPSSHTQCLSIIDASNLDDTLRFEEMKIKVKGFWQKVRTHKKFLIDYEKNTCHKFLAIIEILNMNTHVMSKCHEEIYIISKGCPPQKNENKFIYGKLIERSLIRAFLNIGLICIDLDEKHKVGSEYKNDINMLGINISIKAKLNKPGNIILINKKSKSEHDFKVETLVCLVNDGQIIFIPSHIVDWDIYIIQDAGCISYKSTLLTMINKKFKNYIYKFHEIVSKEKINSIIPPNNLHNVLEKHIFNHYDTKL
jgi:hypothetical protein